MTPPEAYAALLREHIAPALAAEGFECDEETFHRPVERNWEIIGLEHTRVLDHDRIKISVHLAVAIHRLRSAGQKWSKTTPPPRGQRHFAVGLGQLLTGSSVWWDLRLETDVDMLGETLVEAIRRYGLPWLEARSSDERLRNTYLSDLDSVAWWELRPLRELVAQLGPAEAREALDAELRRRAESESRDR